MHESQRGIRGWSESAARAQRSTRLFTFLVEVLSESLKRSLACPPPTGVSGTLGAAESVTGAMTGAATGVGTDTGEIGGVSSETLFICLKINFKKFRKNCKILIIYL